MKIFTAEQVRRIDAATIEQEPVPSIDLMERASLRFVEAFVKHFRPYTKIAVFAGSGNNGGDGLAIARMLLLRQYDVLVFHVEGGSALSPDCSTNLERYRDLTKKRYKKIKSPADFPDLRDCIIIDALFGSGLNRAVEGTAAEIIKKINASGCTVVAVDIPSGLSGEDNENNNPEFIVNANRTFTFQFPFVSFFYPENEKFTGTWQVLDIGLNKEAIGNESSSIFFTEASELRKDLRSRPRFSHKGDYGHALLIAGSYGMMGAAVLSSKACLKTGAGLVTVHVPRYGYQVIQTAVPEVMASVDLSDIMFTGIENLDPYTAIGIGPGLGCRTNACKAFEDLVRRVNVPLVIDADGLNILAKNPEWIRLLPPRTILTPHPKEFDRMAGPSAGGRQRYLRQLQFAEEHNLIVVLKGAYTTSVMPDGTTYINSTGNPGMASGGTGDVLTGMILSLLAQGYEPEKAAPLAVFIHGLAADIALQSESMESLTAGDIINHIGIAFNRMRGNGRIRHSCFLD